MVRSTTVSLFLDELDSPSCELGRLSTRVARSFLIEAKAHVSGQWSRGGRNLATRSSVDSLDATSCAPFGTSGRTVSGLRHGHVSIARLID